MIFDGSIYNVTYSYDEFMNLWNYTEVPSKKFLERKGPFFGVMMAPFTITTQIQPGIFYFYFVYVLFYFCFILFLFYFLFYYYFTFIFIL
jgi:hypothetical protein